MILPLAVLDFLCVHPFSATATDAVARLLSLLLLYHFDYRVGRYISLERIIEESRETYYDALERSSRRWHDSAHDAHPWLGYFWGVLIRAYDEFEARVETLKGSKTDQIRAAAARRTGPFGIADLAPHRPASAETGCATCCGRCGLPEGLVRVEGRGPGAKWRITRTRHALSDPSERRIYIGIFHGEEHDRVAMVFD